MCMSAEALCIDTTIFTLSTGMIGVGVNIILALCMLVEMVAAIALEAVVPVSSALAVKAIDDVSGSGVGVLAGIGPSMCAGTMIALESIVMLAS